MNPDKIISKIIIWFIIGAISAVSSLVIIYWEYGFKIFLSYLFFIVYSYSLYSLTLLVFSYRMELIKPLIKESELSKENIM